MIDLGPEGGLGGGRVIAAGTPEQLAAVAESYTGQYLKPVLREQEIAAPAKKQRKNNKKSAGS